MLGIAADNYTLKFAVFHTLFNLVGVALMLPLISTLVVALEKIMHEKTEPPETARVLFLNDAALEFPDTALEVLNRETMHLAFNAFEILAHGINLHRREITSAEDINTVITRCDDIVDIDIRNLYQRKLKPIYSAILEYGVKAEQKMEPEQVNRLNHLQRADWQIVNAVKAMNELQGNINKYHCAENEYVRREYNGIRLRIALLPRTLFKMDEGTSVADKLERLKEFKLEIEEEDIIANGTLDNLIRENRITPDMATSLMNDTGFAYDIQNNLIEAAEVIFAHISSIDNDTSLSEEEFDHNLLQRQEEIISRLRKEEAEIDAITGRRQPKPPG